MSSHVTHVSFTEIKILKYLLRNGPSRSPVIAANIDGLTTSTVTMRMKELARRGLVGAIQETRQDWGGNDRIVAKYYVSEHGKKVLKLIKDSGKLTA